MALKPYAQPFGCCLHGQSHSPPERLGEWHSKNKALLGRISRIERHQLHMSESNVEQLPDPESSIEQDLNEGPLKDTPRPIEHTVHFVRCEGRHFFGLGVGVDPFNQLGIGLVASEEPFVELLDGLLHVDLVARAQGGSTLAHRLAPEPCGLGTDRVRFQRLDKSLHIVLCNRVKVSVQELDQGLQVVEIGSHRRGADLFPCPADDRLADGRIPEEREQDLSVALADRFVVLELGYRSIQVLLILPYVYIFLFHSRMFDRKVYER